jgi:hypothetical protein
MTTSPMKQDLPLSHDAPRGGKINPAFFVPVLYVMQGMPVTTVQEMFVVTWKDLHVANPLIVSWLSILTLPWSFKLFWSPLIDINSTKRRWTVAMELLLTAAFIAIAWAITLPQYAGDAPQTGFFVALSLLFLMGCFSCTHDIACDGLYILSLAVCRRPGLRRGIARKTKYLQFSLLGDRPDGRRGRVWNRRDL